MNHLGKVQYEVMSRWNTGTDILFYFISHNLPESTSGMFVDRTDLLLQTAPYPFVSANDAYGIITYDRKRNCHIINEGLYALPSSLLSQDPYRVLVRGRQARRQTCDGAKNETMMTSRSV